ncbi:DUF1972 domain-containing protein [Apibacter sp. HY039]|uniref:DUF1972 domain-containing protein n=1 Tax=Apibacter sp. HY039 TaxID=2501476 RepID=UPI000FEC2113|nr:DUF1972 domain-containing protein [Apibacter sp. HY039]
MNIAIIGTRGIPNHYGGFEQFAEYLSLGLVKACHQVTVYNSHSHPYQGKEWQGVSIVHCYDPEDKMGTVGQFIYDFNCIKDTRKKNFDIILQLGYTSSSIWGWMLPRSKSVVTTNMDGLEWKRTKYSKKVQKFLQFAEKLGVKYSDFLISDSIGIQDYLKEKYNKNSLYIPYGADLFDSPDDSCISQFNISKFNYNMLIARLEPENSVDTILEGVAKAKNNYPFLVIGKHETKYGEYLKNKFQEHSNIKFLGGIYDINILNNLRYFSNLYFHGHTVGGTNPSLLEAMSSKALICAHKNIFNYSILDQDAVYFENSEDVCRIILTINKINYEDKIKSNEQKINDKYNWDIIVEKYINHFNQILR